MRSPGVLLTLLGLAASSMAAAAENHGSVGLGHGIDVPGPASNPCGAYSLGMNYDGSAENGYCWQYQGVARPCYGAFAEGFAADQVCGIQLKLTGIGAPCGPCDLYVWCDGGGVPGTVLGVTSYNNPCPVATWPSISTHDFPVAGGTSNGFFWLGFWADFSTQPCGYFIAADLDGPGGYPFTNIAPGIGYPTGWQNVSIVWGPTQALGIGAWLGSYPIGGGECPPTSSVPDPPGMKESTWGQIKKVYD